MSVCGTGSARSSARPYFPDSGASFQFLTGPSGAGKTSLLRLLFLSIRPTRGLVNLFGEDVSLLGKDQVANMRQDRHRAAGFSPARPHDDL